MEKINILLNEISAKEDVSMPIRYSLRRLISLMKKNRKGAVVVLEGEEPVGILTERDVVRLLYSDVDLDEESGRFATMPVITASGKRTIGHALNVMIENNIRRLVVIDDSNNFQGLVTQKDILAQLEDDFYRASLRVKHILDRLRDLVFVVKYEPMRGVLETMIRNKISGVPVIENGVAIGIITEKDVLGLTDERVSLNDPVFKYMSSPVISVTLETQLIDVVRLMNTEDVRRVIVNDFIGQTVGILTHRDLIRNLEGDYNELLERKLRHSKEFLNLLPQMMFELTDDGKEQLIVWANEKVLAVVGKKIIDRSVTDLVPHNRWKDIYQALIEKGKIENVKFKNDGQTYELSGFYIPLDKTSEIGRIQLILRDITEEVTQAVTDPLTSIYNRQYLYEFLSKEAERSKRKKKRFAVVMADIDDLKKVNDTFGYPSGDIVLRNISETIVRKIRQYDVVGRYGGEEFLIIMPETEKEKAIKITERIRSDIEKRDVELLDGAKTRVTVSFGIVVFDEDGLSSDDLLVKADERLYQAKLKGKNQVVSQ